MGLVDNAVTPLYLNAADLFSKWGFGDGDCLDDWYWDATGGPLPDGVDDHRLLRRLVREVLVAAIKAAGHTIEVYDIDTIHNPIRAKSFDDIDVPDGMIYGDIDEPTWANDISVIITLDKVKAVIVDAASV